MFATICRWVVVVGVVVGGVLAVRGQQPGSLDATFNAVGTTGGRTFSGDGGGKLLVGGGLLNVGAPVGGVRPIARFNEDGAVDTAFNANFEGINVTGHVVRTDGRVLVYGAFNTLGGHASRGVQLLKDDGSIDTSFTVNVPGTEPVTGVAPAAGGACYVAYSNGRVVRIDAAGAVDPGFVPNPPLLTMPVGVEVQPSGKVLILQNQRVTRLHATGARDNTYVETTQIGLGTDPWTHAVTPTGALYISSNTGSFNGGDFRTLVRLLPDGGADPDFKFSQDGTKVGQRSVFGLTQDPKGRLVVIGSGFTSPTIRVLPSGQVDPAFQTVASLTAIGMDGSGRLMGTGNYIQVTPVFVFRFGLLRLVSDDGPPQPVKPFITSQPQGASVRSGQPASLAVTAGGDGPLSFQWRLAGTNLPGATATRHDIASARVADGGTYDVVVTNPNGSVTSAPVVLQVLGEPFITKPPVGFTAPEGATNELSALLLGEQPLVLQWYRNNTLVGGATGANLAFAPTAAAQAGSYTLVVSNSFGAVTSAPVQVRILASKPSWLVVTNVTGVATFNDTNNPFRPDVGIRIASDGQRGALVLYERGLERWDDAGQRQWAIRYVEPDFGKLSALAVDREGNAYVAGLIHFTATLGDLAMTNNSTVTGPNGHVQAFIAKIDPDGHGLWYRLYEAAGPRIGGLAVDTDGGVLFAAGSGGRNGLARLGSLVVSESEFAAAVVGKIRTDGTPQWFKSFPQFAVNKSSCEADSITADDTGIYVSGILSFSIQFGNFQLQNPSPNPVNWIGKLNASGDPQWIQNAGTPAWQGAPLVAAGGRRWFLNPGNRGLQSWSTNGSLLTNVTTVLNPQAAGTTAVQLGVAADGSPILVGNSAGRLQVGTNEINAGLSRPLVWFGQWNPDGSFRRGRLVATTTNANPAIGGDTILSTAFGVSAAGDVLVSGQFTVGMRFQGTVHGAPEGSVRPDGWRAGAWLSKLGQPANAPEITQQPIAAFELATDGSARIGIRAVGAEPLTYQWRKDGVPIPGANTNTFDFVSAVYGDRGTYDVVVSNPFGSVVSEPSIIAVRPPFTVSVQPAPQLILLGGRVLSGADLDPMAIHGGSIAGKTLRFTITNTTSARFPAASAFGIRLSGAATGGSFFLLAGGAFGQRNGSYVVPFSMPDSTSLRFTRFDGVNQATFGLRVGGEFDMHYDIVEGDGCCATGTFTLEGGPTNATFRVNTSFFVPDGNFQWRRNGVPIPGQTASLLNFAAPGAADAALYDCVITYKGYSETTRAVELRVLTGAPAAPPVLNPGAFQIAPGGMTIPSWPAGYVLQRSDTLLPAAWQTIATQPPVTIPFTGDGAYFQLVPGP